MKKQILILCLIVIVGLVSCGKKEAAYPVVSEIVDGVRIVSNPDYPRDGRITYNLIEEVNIGEEAGPEEYMLNRPFNLKIDDRGYFYIQDLMDCHILVYDDRGTYVRTIGRMGQGPGEFQSPASFDLSPDGRLFVYDGRSLRMTIFDREGNPLGDYRLDRFYRGMLFDRSGRIYLQTSTEKKEVELSTELQEIQMIARVSVMDADGQNKKPLIDIDAETMQMKAMEGGTMSVGGPRYERFVWALNPEQKLHIGFSKTYQIFVLSEDGTVSFRFGREYTPVANKQHEENPRVPEFHPAFYPNMLIDEEGNCWIRQFAPADFEGYLYDIFNPEGIYIRQAVVPFPLFLFKDGRAYSLLVSEFDYPMVKRFRLEE